MSAESTRLYSKHISSGNVMGCLLSPNQNHAPSVEKMGNQSSRNNTTQDGSHSTAKIAELLGLCAKLYQKLVLHGMTGNFTMPKGHQLTDFEKYQAQKIAKELTLIAGNGLQAAKRFGFNEPSLWKWRNGIKSPTRKNYEKLVKIREFLDEK